MSTFAVPAANLFKRNDAPAFTTTATIAARYRADAGLELATGVKTWRDMSANARHLVQATGASQPIIVASAVNGKPGLRFDGSDDFMQALYTLAQPSVRVMAYKNTSFGTAGVHDIVADGGSAGAAVVGSVLAGSYAISAGSSLNYASGTFCNGVYGCMVHEFNGASSAIKQIAAGAITTVTSGNAGATTTAGLTIGALATGLRSANIEVVEAIDFSTIPSAADYANLALYVLGRYAI